MPPPVGWEPKSGTLFASPIGHSKYRSRRCYSSIADRVFDSIGEARRAEELLLLQGQGVISGLEFQVRYPLVTPNGKTFANYYADFRYWESGVQIVEDFKGKRTDVYQIKKKWLTIMGTTVRETGAGKAGPHPYAVQVPAPDDPPPAKRPHRRRVVG